MLLFKIKLLKSTKISMSVLKCTMQYSNLRYYGTLLSSSPCAEYNTYIFLGSFYTLKGHQNIPAGKTVGWIFK